MLSRRFVPALVFSLILGLAPARTAEEKSLKGATKTIDDATVTVLDLDVKHAPVCLLWADAKGSAFYLVDGATGVLRRISYPDFTVQVEKDLERKVGWLSLSAEGPVVTIPDKHEVWLLDTATLAVKKMFSVPDVHRAVSAPGLSYAAVCGKTLAFLDLKTGNMGKFEPGPKEKNQLGFETAAMSPDGKYLFGTSSEWICRYTILQGRVVAAEHGPRLGKSLTIVVSPDSKLVAMPSPGGNKPAGATYGTAIYSVTTFAKTEGAVNGGAYPRAIGFDSTAKLIYLNGSQPLIVFTDGGVKKKEYRIGDKGDDPRQFLPHPDGGKLLMLTGNKLFNVELAKK